MKTESWEDDNSSRPLQSQTFSRGGRGPRYGGPPGNFRNRNQNHSVNEEKIIQVETSKKGLVIGSKGSTVQRIESVTGCRIIIDRESRNELTNVKLVGSIEQIENAEKEINHKVHMYDNGSKRYNRKDDFENNWNSNNNDRSSDNQGNWSSSSGNRNDQCDSNSSRGRYNQNNRDSQQNRCDTNAENQNRFGGDRNQRSDYLKPKYDDQYQNNDNDKNFNSSNVQQNSGSAQNQENNLEPINWEEVYAESDRESARKLAEMPPVIKNVYHEDSEVASMSLAEIENWRKNNMNISVSRVFAQKEEDMKKPIPNPVKTFEQAFRDYPEIMETITRQKFKTPSPIQSQSWPVIMSGDDLIGVAQTGTGKTLAFLLPAFLHIEAQPVPRYERVGPTVLIVSPTRELATQIEAEINKYTYKGIKCVCAYGGGSRRDQLSWLRKDNPEIVVATPGRLDDFVMGAEIKLDHVSYVVLDEADKMLEMGFECQIRKILINVRSDRQSVMTSATWPSGVRRLASQYSNNPVQVVVGSLDLTAVHSVTQQIVMVDEEEKRDVLYEFIHNMEVDDKVIVFCGKKCVTDDIASNLVLDGIKCQSLHGDREQCDREQALHDLKTGEVHILIATDVAARGLDITDITHVFNLDFPRNIEEYVHRIGRTGRAGRSGCSVSLFTRRDWANAEPLIKILTEANQGVPDELIQMAERFEAKKKRDDLDRRGPRRDGGGGRGYRGGAGGGGYRGGRDRY